MHQRFLRWLNLGVFTRRLSRRAKAKSAIRAAASGAMPRASRAFIENLEDRRMLSATYFVSMAGSDNNVGTITAPFRTIQRAANVAQAGDTVDIETGTYQETVTPKYSGKSGDPITYQAYNGEDVTVSGANAITGWTNIGNNVSVANMSWNLGEGNNQVFVNNVGENETAFPNTTTDPADPATIPMQSVKLSGSTVVIGNSALTQPAGYWVGAIIHMDPGSNWINQSGVVTASSPGSITVSYTSMGTEYYTPTVGDAFYLMGKYVPLNTDGQWFRTTAGQLELYTPTGANANNESVQAQERLYAFDLSNVNNITIKGLNIFAATIKTGFSSNNVILNGIHAEYVSKFIIEPNGWWVSPIYGIMLNGTSDVLENSTVSYSSGDGVEIGGQDCVVTNNVIQYTDEVGADDAAIRILAPNNTVTHNTIAYAGRDGIYAKEAHLTIEYNVIHDVGLQTTEPGGIYTAQTDGEGSVIAYNEIYNIHTGGWGGTAIFLDISSNNWIVHNNITWNVDNGLKMNYTSWDNDIYNNTIQGTLSITTDQVGSWAGCTINNNVFIGAVAPLYTPGGKEYDNVTAATTNTAYGAGTFAAGASGVATTTPVVATPPVTTTPVTTTPPVTTPPVTTTPTTTSTVSASALVKAVSYTGTSGMAPDGYGGMGHAASGAWVSYALNFGTGGEDSITAEIAAMYAGGKMQIRLGSATGTLLGTLNIATTGAWNKYTAQSAAITKVTGVQTIYLVFTGTTTAIANIDSLTFTTTPVTTTPTTASAVSASALVKAASYTGTSGMSADGYGGMGHTASGDWVSYTLNFGTGGEDNITAGLATMDAGGAMQIRLGSPTGTLLGTINIATTGAWNNYTSQSAEITKVTGVQTIYLVFTGTTTGIANIDWLTFW